MASLARRAHRRRRHVRESGKRGALVIPRRAGGRVLVERGEGGRARARRLRPPAPFLFPLPPPLRTSAAMSVHIVSKFSTESSCRSVGRNGDSTRGRGEGGPVDVARKKGALSRVRPAGAVARAAWARSRCSSPFEQGRRLARQVGRQFELGARDLAAAARRARPRGRAAPRTASRTPGRPPTTSRPLCRGRGRPRSRAPCTPSCLWKREETEKKRGGLGVDGRRGHKTSAEITTRPLSPSSLSPMNELARGSSDMPTLARPKSVTLTCPAASRSTFSGFRSRCTKPSACRWATASTISAA